MKKIFLRFLSVLLAVQGFAFAQLLTAQTAQASEAPEIVINEVMWMGTSASTSDEWIELRNTTDASIDLSGWKLTHSATGDTTLVIGAGLIPAEGYFLISNYSETSTSSVLNVAPDVITASLALLNSCTQIDLTMSDDTVVDSMGCDESDYFFPPSSSTEHALERNIEIADGTVATSWHERLAGSANLDPAVTDLATPKFVNDETPANTTAAIVNDGLADDVDWSDDSAVASANWDGFADLESGLTGEYAVQLLDSLDNVIDSDTVTDTTVTFSTLSLTEGEEYHFAVSAMNNVGLESLMVLSDGFTLDTAIPDPASNLVVTDIPGDNGGSVMVGWDASASPDQITYRVDYQKVGEATVLGQNVGSALQATINGLANDPAEYDFTVVAIDFSGLVSAGNPTVRASAQDNLAPLLDPTKVIVDQNKPGTADMIRGWAGASSEKATVTIFDRNPSDPARLILASVLTLSDGGFDAVSVGDNLYGFIWIQLVDQSGNAGTATPFTNDIVGPNAPLIIDAQATCLSERCRVEISWTDSSSDAVEYRVEYGSGVERKLSLPVANKTLILDLAANGSFQDFVVYGYDQFGNRSAKSQHFLASLVPGVVTKAVLVNGELVTTTYAVEGSRETLQVEDVPLSAKLVPAALAAEDEPVDEAPSVAGSQDWLRIFVVVILLLIIAGGFYSLSRSMQKSALDIPAKKPKTKTKLKTGKVAKKTKRRRRPGK